MNSRELFLQIRESLSDYSRQVVTQESVITGASKLGIPLHPSHSRDQMAARIAYRIKDWPETQIQNTLNRLFSQK